jgi:glycosyltransferase involved in cell wall biosynthesis
VRLAELGIEPERLRVVPHPVFSSYPKRNDDGRTILCLGLIRDYKGLDDSIAVARHFTNVRLLVAGDPMEPVGHYRRAAGAIAEWRLGYLSEGEVDRALGEATLALFPYRAGIDQSGALMRTLGAGVAAVVYDIGSLGDCVRRFGAGRVVPPGDIKGLVAAVRELLEDPVALELARAGARRARDCLTWEAAAARHLEIYRELAPYGT